MLQRNRRFRRGGGTAANQSTSHNRRKSSTTIGGSSDNDNSRHIRRRQKNTDFNYAGGCGGESKSQKKEWRKSLPCRLELNNEDLPLILPHTERQNMGDMSAAKDESALMMMTQHTANYYGSTGKKLHLEYCRQWSIAFCKASAMKS